MARGASRGTGAQRWREAETVGGGLMRIGLRCDADPATGVGHVMRCLALGEALRSHAEIVVLGRVDVPWLRDLVEAPIFPGAQTPATLVAQAQELGLDAVVLDSYTLDPASAGELRRHAVVTVAVVDGETRGQEAD